MQGKRGKFGRRDRPARDKGPSATAKRARAGDSCRAGSRRGSTSRQDAPRAGRSVEGVVSANRAGYGFVRVDELKESVFLPPPEMRGLMHGDRVRVSLATDSSGRWLGSVEKILERGVNAFLGTIEIQGRGVWVSAADRRLQLRCTVAPSQLKGARNGDWVIARITRHASSGGSAEAAVEKLLDPDRPVELATESAIARFDLPHEFSEAVLRETQVFGDKVDSREAKTRTDLRDLPLVTIDGDDAKDFDDAVFAERHPQGFRLIVAIADVSHYVRPGTALDAAAVERGTSVYFPKRVVPMLPPALSDHLCSLDSARRSPLLRRGHGHHAAGIHQGGAFLRGDHALRRAPDLLAGKRCALRRQSRRPAADRSALRRQGGSLTEKLMVLVDVYRALHKARARRGALDFDAPEAEFVIDAADHVRAIELRARNDAHRLIEECMIAANVAVANGLETAGVPTLFRVHGQPDEQKIEKLIAALVSLGIDARLPETIKTRDIQAITKRLGSSEARPFVESLVVRSLPQALYQPLNIGHFGLALTQYAHFTSPIRRYPDLVVHRTLRALAGEKGGASVRYEVPELTGRGEALSKLEKRADEADRYVNTFLKCVYLRERIGQTFHGLITTVVEFGCFVQILEVNVDGLLHIDQLKDDNYVMSDDGHAWIGRQHGRRLHTGAKVRVVVTAVKPIEGLIDLELAEDL